MGELWLIRHGMTEGNKTGKYIGITDEPLSPEGREMLAGKEYPTPELVFASPLKRCRETAEILFPGVRVMAVEELAECDFGHFENKNYLELTGNEEYQAWIDSNGTLPFPGGESREDFQSRVLQGFRRVLQECGDRNIRRAALVVHGGTIMTIMERYGKPEKSFYEWQLKNGEGYRLTLKYEKNGTVFAGREAEDGDQL